MTREEIASRLIEALKNSTEEPVDWSGLTETTELESLGLDSLTVLDLLFYIREQLGIDVEVGDLTDVRTFGDLVTFMMGRIPSA